MLFVVPDPCGPGARRGKARDRARTVQGVPRRLLRSGLRNVSWRQRRRWRPPSCSRRRQRRRFALGSRSSSSSSRRDRTAERAPQDGGRQDGRCQSRGRRSTCSSSRSSDGGRRSPRRGGCAARGREVQGSVSSVGEVCGRSRGDTLPPEKKRMKEAWEVEARVLGGRRAHAVGAPGGAV